MYKTFRVNKKTGTYSDTIEAFGLANLLNEIQIRANFTRPKLWIEDKDLYYEITSKPEIEKEDISNLCYFPLFQWAIHKDGDTFDEAFFNYPEQKKLKDERYEKLSKIIEQFSGSEKETIRKNKRKEIEAFYKEKIKDQYDVYQQFIDGKPNIKSAFAKLYGNFKDFDRESFSDMIFYILNSYSGTENLLEKIDTKNPFCHTITSGQLLSPTDGLGLLNSKANGLNENKPKRFWVSETMKISGALSNMHCKLVKITNKSWDLKVIVPDFKKVNYSIQRNIVKDFKRNVLGSTPLKIDILNLLIITKKLIENTDEHHKFKAKNILTGLHSTYQKDLGNNKAVANIAKLNIPDFIEFTTEEEAKSYILSIDENINIIRNIDEHGDATRGLIAYRTFLTSSDFMNWAKFTFWYSEHLMSILSKNKYAVSFKINTLNKFFNNMSIKNFKISEITSNEGFLKVAYAIRKSTVTLQYTPKEQRQFEIRYGVAQSLQNKSKSASDLAAFIGEFIGLYNSETARKAELSKGFRKIVREDELNEFYSLLDNYPSKVVGALLVSYGFALEEKEAKEIENKTENNESNENNNQ